MSLTITKLVKSNGMIRPQSWKNGAVGHLQNFYDARYHMMTYLLTVKHYT